MSSQLLANLSQTNLNLPPDSSDKISLTNPSVLLISNESSLYLYNISKGATKEVNVNTSYSLFSPDNSKIAISSPHQILLFSSKVLATSSQLTQSSAETVFTFNNLITFKFASLDKIIAIEETGITICDLKSGRSKLFISFSALDPSKSLQGLKGRNFSYSADYANFLISGTINSSPCSFIISKTMERIVKVPSKAGVVCNSSPMPNRTHITCVYLTTEDQLTMIELTQDSPNKKSIPVFSQGESANYLHLSESQTQLTVFSQNGKVRMLNLKNESIIGEETINGSPTVVFEESPTSFIALLNNNELTKINIQQGRPSVTIPDDDLVDISGVTSGTQPDFGAQDAFNSYADPAPTQQTSDSNYDFITQEAIPSNDSPSMISSSTRRLSNPDQIDQLKNLLNNNKTEEAIQLVISCGEELRTPQALDIFKLCTSSDKIPPVIRFLIELVGKTVLKDYESIELAQRFINARKGEASKYLGNWINANKLTPSEELGDIIREVDQTLSLKIYIKSQSHKKVLGLLLLMGQVDKIIPYSQKTNFKPEYELLLNKLYSLISEKKVAEEKAKIFAALILRENPPLLSLKEVSSIMYRNKDYNTYIDIMLKYFTAKGNNSEDADIQTNFLMALATNKPDLLPAILSGKEFNLTYFDRDVVGDYLEEIGMSYLSLLCYKDIAQIKRVLPSSLISSFNSEKNIFGQKQLAGFLKGQLKKDQIIGDFFISIIEYVNNPDNVVSPVNSPEAIRHYILTLCAETIVDFLNIPEAKDKLKLTKILNSLEEIRDYTGIFLVLTRIITIPEIAKDKEKTLLYVKACIETENYKEIENLVKDSEDLDNEQILQSLLAVDLKDPRALIFFCDKFGYISELTTYLMNNDKQKFLNVYVQKFNPKSTSKVVETMLVNGCSDSQIMELVSKANLEQADTSNLVETLLERDKILLIKGSLENYYQKNISKTNTNNEKSKEIGTGLAKIYVYSSPELAANFLKNNHTNINLDVIAEYSLQLDSHTAFIAYTLSNNDKKALELGNSRGFFRELAEYLVNRKEEKAWELALSEKNDYRSELVHSVTHDILPLETNPNKISVVVRAFMKADLSSNLLELLETIIIKTKASPLSKDRNLQNLLILTAIKTDRLKVEEYINKLDNFDYSSIGSMARKYALYEEALLVFDKGKLYPQYFDTILENLHDFNRGKIKAIHMKEQGHPEIVKIFIESGLNLKTNDFVREVVNFATEIKELRPLKLIVKKCNENNFDSELLNYLNTVKLLSKDTFITYNILYLLVKEKDNSKLKKFLIDNPNISIDKLATDCYKEGNYMSAAVLYENLKLYEKAGLCYIKTQDFLQAYACIDKSNSKSLMKELLGPVLENKKLEIAENIADKMLASVDLTDFVVEKYEALGYIEELIAIMEKASETSKANQVIFTSLAILYCKYKEEKLESYVRVKWNRVIVAKLLKVMNSYCCYKSSIHLLMNQKQFDSALKLIVEQGPICFDEELFKQAICNSMSSEVLFSSVQFLIDYFPELLEAVLLLLGNKIDFRKVVKLAEKKDCFFLVIKYLEKLGVSSNNRFVVEMLCKVYVEEEMKVELLRYIRGNKLVNFRVLGRRLENHERADFRKLGASMIYKSGDIQKAITNARKDNDYITLSSLIGDSKDKDKVFELVNELKEKGLESFCLIVLVNASSWCPASFVMKLSYETGFSEIAMPLVTDCMERAEENMRMLTEKVNRMAARINLDGERKSAEGVMKTNSDKIREDYNVSRLAIEGARKEVNKRHSNVMNLGSKSDSGGGRGSVSKHDEYGF